ncbi:hypothetical protein K2X05_03950 [bacterium]|nr:hypothetical protein [bacterium]
MSAVLKKISLLLFAVIITPILFLLIGEIIFRIWEPKIDLHKFSLFKPTTNTFENLNTKYRLKTDWSKRRISNFNQSPNYHIPLERSGDVWIEENDGYINLKANYTAFHKAIHPDTSEIVYDVKYSQDLFRRRLTIGHTQNASKHLILSGCSSTFGEGINDDQTLSYFLQKKMPEANVFNLGIPGGSVVTALTTITTRNNWDGISPKNGLLLFSYSTKIHVPRFLGTIMIVGSWYHHGAFLKTNKAGNYEYGGIYYLHKPLRSVLSKILSQSKLLSAINFDWPLVNDRAIENYAKAIDQLKMHYRKKYSSENELVVYFWPTKKKIER